MLPRSTQILLIIFVVQFVTPCGDSRFDDRPILQRASCMARKYGMWMVMDMGDVQFCSNKSINEIDAGGDGVESKSASNACPSDGRFQYNTQIAFSNSGMVRTQTMM